MICCNCSNWFKRNPYTRHGLCLVCGKLTCADTECLNPIPEETNSCEEGNSCEERRK